MPMVIMSWFRETRAPRSRAGDISEMYKGTAKEAAPMASPRVPRPTTSSPTPGARLAVRVPRKKTAAAPMMTRRRPKRSVSLPLKAEPRMAPTRTELTTSSWAREPRPKSWRMNSRAPDMTPVSNPNNSPPMAATKATT